MKKKSPWAQNAPKEGSAEELELGTTRYPPTLCWECGKSLDACIGRRRPAPGDLTLCGYCGSLNTFGEDLRLQKPSDEDMIEAAANPEIQEDLKALLPIIRAMTGKK